MARITRNDDISILNLDKRAYNALKRTGINSIADMLSYNRLRDFSKIMNLGSKNIENIITVIEKIKNHSQDLYLVETDIFAGSGDSSKKEDVPIIDELDISDALKRFLKEAGYSYVYQLEGMTASGLWSTRNKDTDMNINYSSMTGIVNAVKVLEKQRIDSALNQKHDFDGNITSFLAQEISNKFHGSFYTVLKVIKEADLGGIRSFETDYCKHLYELPAIRELVVYWILDILDNGGLGISEKELLKAAPEHLKGTEILSEILLDMEESEKIYFYEGLWYLKLPLIAEYVGEIEDEKVSEMAFLRLSGKTLEEIGKKFNCTKEAVRNILKKAFDMRPKVHEDLYAHLYQYYELSKEDFITAFRESSLAFNYLSLFYEKIENRPFSEAKYDPNISDEMLLDLKRVEDKKYVSIFGMRIRREYNTIIEFILKNECSNTITFDEFLGHYHGLLEQLNLVNDTNFETNARVLSSKLSNSLTVLWTPRKLMRYYDIKAYNFDKLESAIDLKKYYGMTVSAIKLFEEYREMMDSYDIRNGYELHNLLRKIDFGKELGAVYGRNPTINIGTVE